MRPVLRSLLPPARPLLRRSFSSSADTDIPRLHKLQPASVHLQPSALLRHLLSDADLSPLRYDFAEELERHPEFASLLGGRYGNDHRTASLVYFVPRTYASRASDSVCFRSEHPADARIEDIWLVGAASFTEYVAGPAPDAVHGGAIATQLDNLCGFVSNGLYYTGHRTASLHVNYRARVPTVHTVAFRARIDRVEGRKTFVSTAFLDPDSVIRHGFYWNTGHGHGPSHGPTVLADAAALMIHVGKTHAKAHMTA